MYTQDESIEAMETDLDCIEEEILLQKLRSPNLKATLKQTMKMLKILNLHEKN